MRAEKTYLIDNAERLKINLLSWAEKFNIVCCLNSNSYKQDKFSSFDFVLAVGVLKELNPAESTENPDSFYQLKKFSDKNKDWIFGFLTYDVKNELEHLTSENFDGIGMPKLHFFVPQYIFFIEKNNLKIISNNLPPDDLFNELLGFSDDHSKTTLKHIPEIKKRIPKNDYLSAIEKIKKHIYRGDIYEMNFCIEFFSDETEINPLDLFIQLTDKSPTPFACYYRYLDQYLISASPERFLKKVQHKIISQPIKGTIKRGKDEQEDKLLKQKLLSDKKELSENVMIVDLVRNDLSKTAVPDSVRIEELFGIYSFKQVHQMITTISSEMRNKLHFTDVIKHAFPMGSMTGAPKVKAMELIEKYETTKRGLFSGCVGYITPEHDFDFNVVIRSLLYNAEKKYLSFMAGSAITAASVAEKEYEECLLKVKAIIELLQS